MIGLAKKAVLAALVIIEAEPIKGPNTSPPCGCCREDATTIAHGEYRCARHATYRRYA